MKVKLLEAKNINCLEQDINHFLYEYVTGDVNVQITKESNILYACITYMGHDYTVEVKTDDKEEHRVLPKWKNYITRK